MPEGLTYIDTNDSTGRGAMVTWKVTDNTYGQEEARDKDRLEISRNEAAIEVNITLGEYIDLTDGTTLQITIPTACFESTTTER